MNDDTFTEHITHQSALITEYKSLAEEYKQLTRDQQALIDSLLNEREILMQAATGAI
jgi:adenylosuccinate synthase